MMINSDPQILFILLRAGLQVGTGHEKFRENIEDSQWERIYRLSSRHGILGIVWDGIRRLSAESRIPRQQRLNWAYNTEMIEQRYGRQKKTAEELSGLFAKEEVPMLIFKGLGLSMYYPVPKHRECGDVDIWLFGRAEQGNQIAAAIGSTVEEENSKHDIIRFRGVTFENHKELTTELLNRRNRSINAELLSRIINTPKKSLFGTGAPYTPDLAFYELYVPVHAAEHFVIGGISLRHICDWALLMQANDGHIEMELFDNLKLGQFVRLLNSLCKKWFGIEVDSESLHQDTQLVARFGKDILHYGCAPTTTSRGKLLQLKLLRFYSRKWCYPIVGGSFYLSAIRSTVAHLISPKNFFKGKH